MNKKANPKTRRETASVGALDVPADRYWGAQTQRSLKYFNIGHDLMPRELIQAFGLLKKATALTNQELNQLPKKKAQLIIEAADEVAAGKLDSHFPLRIW